MRSKQVLSIPAETHEAFLQQLRADMNFLEEHGLTGYALTIGVTDDAFDPARHRHCGVADVHGGRVVSLPFPGRQLVRESRGAESSRRERV